MIRALRPFFVETFRRNVFRKGTGTAEQAFTPAPSLRRSGLAQAGLPGKAREFCISSLKVKVL
jgi:hypothetical protein